MGSNLQHEMGLGDSLLAQEPSFFYPLKLVQLEIHKVKKIAAGGFSAAITDQKQLIIWGSGSFGTFSTPQKVCMEGIEFSDIVLSCEQQAFAAAIDSKGGLYTWGYNEHGQLGQGDNTDRDLPT